MCICKYVCVLFFMPACRSDLPITRSIKPLIPKVHAFQQHRTKKNFLQEKKKKKSESFLSCCLKPKPPVQHALAHEDGNVFYLHNHTSRGLMCTLNSGTGNSHSRWASKDGLNILQVKRNLCVKPFLGFEGCRCEKSSKTKGWNVNRIPVKTWLVHMPQHLFLLTTNEKEFLLI